MPALIPTGHYATVVWLGCVEKGGGSIRSVPIRAMETTYAGVDGEEHAGLTRASCSRVTALHPKGTEIRNVRQFSIVSAEEMAETARDIGLERLEPEWLGASIVVEGIEDFSHVPPSSRLQNDEGATLVIDMENQPCHFPGREIEKDRPGHGKAFRTAAKGRRGVTAWIEREGPIRLGDKLRLFLPTQPAWSGQQ